MIWWLVWKTWNVRTLDSVIPLVGLYAEEIILIMKKHNDNMFIATLNMKSCRIVQSSVTTQWVHDQSWHNFSMLASRTLHRWSYFTFTSVRRLPWGGWVPRPHNREVAKRVAALVPSAAIQVIEEGSNVGSTLWCWGNREAVCTECHSAVCKIPCIGSEMKKVSKLMPGTVPWYQGWCNLDYFYIYFSEFSKMGVLYTKENKNSSLTCCPSAVVSWHGWYRMLCASSRRWRRVCP